MFSPSKNHLRLVIFLILLFSCILAAISVKLSYKNNHLGSNGIHKYETRGFEPNTLFNNGLKVESSSASSSIYLYLSKDNYPPLSKPIPTNKTILPTLLTSSTYSFRELSLYLNEGSSFKVKTQCIIKNKNRNLNLNLNLRRKLNDNKNIEDITNNDDIENNEIGMYVLLFEGRDALAEYEADDTSQSYLIKQFIPINNNNTFLNFDEIEYTIEFELPEETTTNTGNEYFIIYKNPTDEYDLIYTSYLSLYTTQYELNQNNLKCLYSYTCYITLPFASEALVVIDNDGEPINLFNNSNNDYIIWSGTIRYSFYIFCFGTLPIIYVLFYIIKYTYPKYRDEMFKKGYAYPSSSSFSNSSSLPYNIEKYNIQSNFKGKMKGYSQIPDDNNIKKKYTISKYGSN